MNSSNGMEEDMEIRSVDLSVGMVAGVVGQIMWQWDQRTAVTIVKIVVVMSEFFWDNGLGNRSEAQDLESNLAL